MGSRKLITTYHFNNIYSQAEVDLITNNMLVNLSDFSQYSCDGGVMYGVETTCEHCDLEINACMRTKIMPILAAAQGLVEREIGYALTPRGVIHDVQFKDGMRVKLSPGITDMMYSQQLDIVDTGTVDVYLSEEVEVLQSTYSVASFPAALVGNPNQVTIWADDELNTYAPYRTNGYPRRSGTNWQITVDRNAPTGSNYKLSHCNLVKVDWQHNGAYRLSEINLFYPGTKQIVPEAKPRQKINESTIRFWLHRWVVMHPDFFTDGMSVNENYKLLTELSVGHFRSVYVQPVAVCSNDPDQLQHQVNVSVVDAQRGIVQLDLVENCLCSGVLEMTLYYRTDPQQIVGFGETDLVNAREAIIWHAAAELPMTTCGCNANDFIKTAQANYNDVVYNPFTGDTIVKPKFGELHGHFKAQSNMAQMYTIPEHFKI